MKMDNWKIEMESSSEIKRGQTCSDAVYNADHMGFQQGESQILPLCLWLSKIISLPRT